MPELERREFLCAREIFQPLEIQKHLRCRYVNRGIPFLKIAPFKEEEIFLEPRILLLHDVISDKEIDIIKNLAKPKFATAGFRNVKSGSIDVDPTFRDTKTGWLLDSESIIVEDLSYRIRDMTQLNMETAEQLQVAYYDVGGHYRPHYDFAVEEDIDLFKHLGTGNRIATVLFYFNDVEEGGNTVFTEINVSLKPKKGAAAFWYNLQPNGERDFLTRHSACPVISGFKWDSSIFIMARMLLLIVAVVLAASSNGNREFVSNLGVLKNLLNTKADLIEKLLDEIAHQQQQLKTISNEEVYSKELEDVAYKASEYSLSAKRTISMLTGLENLWPKIDDYVKEIRSKIGLHNVTSSETGCEPDYDYDDYEHGIFDNWALKLCNGMISQSSDIEKHLKCRFVDYGNPFLKIAPFKQEDVYLDPFIVIYHNVLSDAEIEMLQEEAYPALYSSSVTSEMEGAHSSKIRISEHAWLIEEYYPKVKSINERAGHMTDLNIGTSEPLQIAYYKPGGYFNEHVDFDPNKDNPFPNKPVGNRIGTLMFYLNNVQEGGKTIFSFLNITLTPKKGNAVFWYNTLPNGDLDYFTMHAGCRVVSGVKWVANKWFHEHGQEYRRPCLLKNVYDKYRSGYF
ncbi:uncharacterized protein LOC122500757 [Leptopilina heterotoma]|uniref:uncharacterized protein LOC122500757 n=1 Tax=Leptopilina heterotoma TaxID=63436 RepID=UPI001CA87294|nr:uncharacterized protein LOC122500757 [Leptopilina heterotoma]